MTELIQKAWDTAEKAHKGQKRRNGVDYFNGHVVQVYLYLLRNYESLFPGSAISQGSWGKPDVKDAVLAAALLHDVVEDTDVTLEDLTKLGFPVMTVEIVEILTRRENETYFDYIMRVHNGGNPIHDSCGAFRVGAVAIKLSDLWHNLSDEPLKRDQADKYLLAEYILKYFNR